MIKSGRRFYKQVLLSIVCSFIFNTSYGQHLKSDFIKNSMLPKEINLPPQTVKFMDSIFVFENGTQQLETIQVFDLKNGILVSGNREYYVNGILNQTTVDRFDHNGNNIQSITTFHVKNSTQVFLKKLDEKGNIIYLTTTEEDRQNVIYYKNIYRQDKLAEQSVISKNSGTVIEKITFRYDAHGNLTEEWVKASHRDAKNLYEYNKNHQVIRYQHIRNGKLSDKICYHYREGLLRKTESFDGLSAKPSIEHHVYNEARQLVLVRRGASNDKTEYKDFDEFNNWQTREQYVSGELSRLTKRQFFIR